MTILGRFSNYNIVSSETLFPIPTSKVIPDFFFFTYRSIEKIPGHFRSILAGIETNFHGNNKFSIRLLALNYRDDITLVSGFNIGDNTGMRDALLLCT